MTAPRIPTKAVEAVAKAMSGYPEGWDRLPDTFRQEYRDIARNLLEAAMPFLQETP